MLGGSRLLSPAVVVSKFIGGIRPSLSVVIANSNKLPSAQQCPYNNNNNNSSSSIISTGYHIFHQRQCFSTSAAVLADKSHMMLILGAPGGGKGTISGKILKDFPQFHHVSTGDILRQHVQEGTELGKKAKEYMENGQLVPDDVMISLLMEEATPFLENGDSLLLDGFPRTLQQAESLEQVVHIDIVVNLKIPTDVIVERISDRWIHAASGRIYSYSYKPPKVRGIDDITGEPLTQRDDDTPASVRTRLDAYDKITSPLVEFYSKKGVLKTFSGTMSDIIYPQVKDWLDKQF